MDNDPQPPSGPPEAPDKEKMDQIRRRRLEKLAGPSTPKPDSSASPTVPTPTPSAIPVEKAEPKEVSKPKINITKASSPTSENPIAQLGARPLNGSSTPTNAPKPPPKKATAPPSEESIEDYENRTLGSIFRITLDPNQKADASNHRLIYLPNLRQELEDEAVPIMLTKERLDSAIVEAASTIPHNKSVL
jgi:ubiquitin conjugation factor E4 B